VSDCNCGSQGALSEVAIIDGESVERYDFVREDLGLREAIVGDQGITGRLYLFADHIRDGPAFVAGGMMMNVSARELENWLPRILRGTKTDNTHFPGNETPDFDIIVRRDKATFRYNDCQVDKCLIRASATSEQPSLVEMMLTFVGKNEVEGTWPDPAPARLRDNNLYWLMADSTLTLNGDEYPFEAFNLQYDNMLEPLIRNSLRPICIQSQGQRVRLQPMIPLCAASASNLYFTRLDGAVSLHFESDKNLDVSTSETNFQIGRVYGPKVTPSTRGKVETFLPLDLVGYPGADEDLEPLLKVLNIFPA